MTCIHKIRHATIIEERPDLIPYMVNPEDAGKYRVRSSQRVDWLCPECGKIVPQKTIHKVTYRGIPCPYCSDGVSKPEKIVRSALDQLGIQFEYQKIFAWSGKKRYDFYIPDKNCIIEVNGAQHYRLGYELLSGISLEDQKNVDALKYKMASDNGVKSYFVIEAISTFARDIIPKLRMALCDIGITGEIDIAKCEMAAATSNVAEAARLWNAGNQAGMIEKTLGVSRTAVLSYLKRAADIGLCNYSTLEAHRCSQRNAISSRRRTIKCVTTGETFESIHAASRRYNISSPYNIIRSCKGANRHAGVSDTGVLLKWEYA